MLDQEHLAFAIEHNAAYPERHAAGEAKIQMEQASKLRLKSPSQSVQIYCHHISGYPDMVFDPCAGAAGLPIHERTFQKDITR